MGIIAKKIMKSLLFRVIFLGVVGILLAVLVIFRYQLLKTRVDITQFFNDSSYVLSFLLQDDFSKRTAPIPEEVKKQPKNLLPEVTQAIADLKNIPFYDPFSSAGEPGKPLELRFGRVQHPMAIQSPFWTPDRARWFTWSRGPSRREPEIKTEPIHDDYSFYRFVSPPYQVSNGLWSDGYLYLDSKGLELGKIR